MADGDIPMYDRSVYNSAYDEVGAGNTSGSQERTQKEAKDITCTVGLHQLLKVMVLAVVVLLFTVAALTVALVIALTQPGADEQTTTTRPTTTLAHSSGAAQPGADERTTTVGPTTTLVEASGTSETTRVDVGAGTTTRPTTLPAIVSDCQVIYDSGHTSSGLYDINPTWSQDPIQVYCNMSDGGGWTVFQRHFIGPSRQDFNQNWSAYRDGFGTPSEQFWIGNEKLFRLTNTGTYELRIDLVNSDHSPYYAKYDFFRISGEGDEYQLSGLGTFSGSAETDAIRSTRHLPEVHKSENMLFSTLDRDNDRSPQSCAALSQGGWWFNSCFGFNPNYGLHLDSSRVGSWYSAALGGWDGLIYTEMKIRPRKTHR